VSVGKLHELFDLNTDTGELRWRVNRRRARCGDLAGTTRRSGRTFYQQIVVDYAAYPAHVLVWAMTHGEWPERDIDHRDHNGLHNWPRNLRLATDGQNQANRRATSGKQFKGVCWEPSRQKWQATITVRGHKLHLGRFTDERTAALHYDAAHKLLWPEITNAGALNFPPEDSDEIYLRKSLDI